MHYFHFFIQRKYRKIRQNVLTKVISCGIIKAERYRIHPQLITLVAHLFALYGYFWHLSRVNSIL